MAKNRDLSRTLMHVAWMSIALGIVIELALIGVAVAYGAFASKGMPPFIADLAGKISWSVIVCMGVAVGSAVSKTKPVWSGIFGLLAAPVAFAVAKAAHKSAAQGLSVPPLAVSVPGSVEMMTLRGIEYLLLGLTVAWLSARAWSGLRHFVGVGLTLGALACGYVLWRTMASAEPPAAPALVAKGVNEVLFPVGCSIVLFATRVLVNRVPKMTDPPEMLTTE